MNGPAQYNTCINVWNQNPFTWIWIGSSVVDKEIVASDLADVAASENWDILKLELLVYLVFGASTQETSS